MYSLTIQFIGRIFKSFSFSIRLYIKKENGKMNYKKNIMSNCDRDGYQNFECTKRSISEF